MNPCGDHFSQDCVTQQQQPGLGPRVEGVRLPLKSDEAIYPDNGARVENNNDPSHRYGELEFPQSGQTTTSSLDSIQEKQSSKTTIGPKAHAPAEDMPLTDRPEKPPLPSKAFKKYVKVARLQDRFFTDQTRLKSARDDIGPTFASLKESLSQFVQLSPSTDAQRNDVSRSDVRNNAHAQLMVDIQTLEEQMQQVTELEQSLSKLEYRLANIQPKLLRIIDDSFDFKHRYAMQAGSPSSSYRHPTPPLDAVQSAYYEKRGDVRLLHTRLFNLQAELQRLQIDASVLPDPLSHDVEDAPSLEQTDSAQAQLQTRYETTQQKLQQEERELKSLWEDCVNAGFDVGSLSAELIPPINNVVLPSPPPSESPETIELDTPPFLLERIVPQFLKNFHWPQRGAFAASPFPELPDLGEKWDSIQKWLQTTAGVDASSRKSDSDWILVHKVSDDILSPDDVETVPTADSVVPRPEPLRPEGVRRLRREWKSDESLRQKFRQDLRPKRGSADVDQGVGRHQS